MWEFSNNLLKIYTSTAKGDQDDTLKQWKELLVNTSLWSIDTSILNIIKSLKETFWMTYEIDWIAKNIALLLNEWVLITDKQITLIKQSIKKSEDISFIHKKNCSLLSKLLIVRSEFKDLWASYISWTVDVETFALQSSAILSKIST